MSHLGSSVDNYNLSDEVLNKVRSYSELELRRILCRESLHEFVKEFWSVVESQPFVDGWHIRVICEHLEAVTRGDIKRIVVNVPPGTGKSMLISVLWPVWTWVKNPALRYFCASYDQKLSTRDSVRSRALIESNKYQQMFGHYRIVKGQDLKTYYETDKGGWRLATSVGGHGTGEHPDVLLVDDAHNVQQAESEVERQAVMDWWDLTMSSRGMVRDVRRVIIMQRLHERDLTAHVLGKGDFVHLCLPMRYEPDRACYTPLGKADPRTEEGELLIPQLFTEEIVCDLEKSLGEYGRAGQLQQRPAPRGGGMFKSDYFSRRVKAAPYDCTRIRFTDRAATAGGGCYSASVLMAKSKTNPPLFYVEHVFRGQWEPRERNQKIIAAAYRDRSKYGSHEPIHVIEAERGSTGMESFQNLAAMMAGFRVREDIPSGSKDTRAEPWADQLAAGNVYIVDDGTWPVHEYVDEHLGFRPEPGKRVGGYKDMVDASSGAFNLLAGTKINTGVRVVSFSTGKKSTFKIVVCSSETIATVVLDQHACLLVSVSDPLPLGTDEIPAHGLTRLVGTLKLRFADIQPADYQDCWETPLADYGKLPAEVIMTREHGKTLWGFLLKKREFAPQIFVIHDDNHARGASLACGICDGLGYRKNETIYTAGDPTPVDKASIPYLYEVVRASRSLVM